MPVDQVSDWTFHKRICAKPKPAATETAAPTPAAAPAPAAAAKAVASTEELHISDDEDAQAIKEASRGSVLVCSVGRDSVTLLSRLTVTCRSQVSLLCP
jgi:hypothetical protein